MNKRIGVRVDREIFIDSSYKLNTIRVLAIIGCELCGDGVLAM
jgi:hypothetical protein